MSTSWRHPFPAPWTCDEPQEPIPRKGLRAEKAAAPSTELRRLVGGRSNSEGFLPRHWFQVAGDDDDEDGSVDTADVEIEAIEARLRALKIRKARQIAVECSLLRAQEQERSRSRSPRLSGRQVRPPPIVTASKIVVRGGPSASPYRQSSPMTKRSSSLATPRPRTPSPERVCNDDMLRLPQLRPSPQAGLPFTTPSQVSVMSPPPSRHRSPQSAPCRSMHGTVERSPRPPRGHEGPCGVVISPLARCVSDSVRAWSTALGSPRHYRPESPHVKCHSVGLVSSGTQTPRRRSRSRQGRQRHHHRHLPAQGYRNLLLAPLGTNR
ncbi:hypothetical protein FOL47_001289 [Perkinsus chesapeaki]|uniref:Uncharacterized protein n=1 Tax=Perkinsus chesapeaki TaxID=330153 RepID=A0A7J6N1H6_PERCH|nr:hypothetical protein FOL47_001289 [Perkinsus chesapeaki]